FPVVSGPYRLAAFRENVSATLERRADWWARGRKMNQGVCNFQTLVFRFFTDQDNAFEALKKGDIDAFAVYTARQWANETQGERFDKHWIVKQRVTNHHPVGFQGFAMNMRRPPYDDARVRRALAMLLDRETLNRTFMHGAYFLHASYYEDLYAGESAKDKPALVPFDPAAAQKILAEAGWQRNAKNGALEKDGKPFVINFLTRDPTSDRFLAFYSAELKKIGIELKIDRKDFASWMRDMQAFNFEMTWSAYGGGIFRDPEPMWSSAEAARPSGANVTGFSDPAVDALIEKQKTVFDLAERNAILREIDAIVTARTPYVLLWNINATRLLYWDKFGRPATVLGKYGSESAIQSLWWFDEDLAAELEDAMQNGDPLPLRPEEVSFDL
ncbi:MAG: ABC transporter substrate-binding protein, partial [Kiritimatiellaeota bacterium]|nr:ABC transporter substrate-binding protein [Kiritimatiellota bacterium]